ncbi:MAG: L-threonylcarbamoyladenylate synthase [Gemmatimonadales bacterium]|jgi:L-threonylcarbamoyladenylate synthase
MQEIEVVSAPTDTEREVAARRAAEVLAAGGVVIHPTETVYGIGGDGSASNNALISRIKRRAATQPLILLALNRKSFEGYFPGLQWSEPVLSVVERFWPGPLTVIVPCATAPEGLTGSGGGIALRVTADPTVRAILSAWQRPMTSTSANLTGAAPARTLAEAVAILEPYNDSGGIGVPVLGVDGGRSPTELPSTIVSFLEAPPRLVREGPLTREQLLPSIAGLK